MSAVERPVEAHPPAPAVAPWYPPPTYPPPQARQPGATEGRAIGALLAAIFGIVLGLPLGVPGMVLGTVAYFVGRSAVRRIDGSEGASGGRNMAVSAWVLGAVAMAIGSAVTLVWLVVFLVAVSGPTTTG
ncbi:MAG: hypothetical protein ABI401_03115 [Candidatus Dormibacter sp.]